LAVGALLRGEIYPHQPHMFSHTFIMYILVGTSSFWAGSTRRRQRITVTVEPI
jgi:hypothetical protein